MYEENEKLKAELKIFKIRALKEKAVLFGVLILILAELIALGMFLKKTLSPSTPVNRPYVAVININKTITVDYINSLMDKMNRLKKDKNCKEYLLVFNTPGGSPSASDEFNAYLKFLNKTKKVNVYVESMAASGGYYIISAIRPIVANKNAVVGSIGVIMPHYVIGKLAKKLGIEEDDITVGKYKKPISLFEKTTPEERKYLMDNLLLPTYENFLQTVAQDRNIPVEKLKKYADGKIFIASKVKGILVDKISTLTQFKNEIKKNLGGNVVFVNISLNKRKFPYLNIKLDSDLGQLLKGYLKQ
jgi:protease-4